jgi:hypothetical protein
MIPPLPFGRGEGRGEGSRRVVYPTAPSVTVPVIRISDFGLPSSVVLLTEGDRISHPPFVYPVRLIDPSPNRLQHSAHHHVVFQNPRSLRFENTCRNPHVQPLDQ